MSFPNIILVRKVQLKILPATQLNGQTKNCRSKSNVNCCVYGCKSIYKKNPELSFHVFPSVNDEIEYESGGAKSLISRRKLWEMKLKMGKPATKTMHVCQLHFLDEDYKTPADYGYKRRYLKKTAVPSQNLPKTSAQNRLIQNQQIQHPFEEVMIKMEEYHEEDLPPNNCSVKSELDLADPISVQEAGYCNLLKP